jgi:ABC-type polysaccharide/polyol phosphate export permease
LGAILSIFVLVWLLVFTVGLSLLTSSMQIKYRDVNFFVQTFLILWFYATPVLYNLSLIPKPLTGFFSLNPLTSIFELLHVFLLKQGTLDTKILVVNVVESVIIVFLGVRVFRKESKYFVDWL